MPLPLPTLSPATCGLTGYARLTFAPQGGRTRLTEAVTRPPLAVQRALYLDDASPDIATVFLLNTTAGLFQGDRLRLEASALPGGRVHLTTGSAAKVFTMPQGEARQETVLTVAPGALLEYLPDPLIPFQGSRFSQVNRLSVHPGGALLYGDVLTPGRVGMGEELLYSSYRHRLTLDDGQGGVQFHEAFELRPGERPLERLGLLGKGGHTVMATLLAVLPERADAFLSALQELLDGAPEVTGGAGPLPGGGVALRLMAPEARMARRVLHAAWDAFRRTLYGTGAPNLRKY